jgi:hypothetical protein
MYARESAQKAGIRTDLRVETTYADLLTRHLTSCEVSKADLSISLIERC